MPNRESGVSIGKWGEGELTAFHDRRQQANVNRVPLTLTLNHILLYWAILRAALGAVPAAWPRRRLCRPFSRSRSRSGPLGQLPGSNAVRVR